MIRTKPATKEYRKNFDRVFKWRKAKPNKDEHYVKVADYTDKMQNFLSTDSTTPDGPYPMANKRVYILKK